jgi:hypothetical protein
MSKKPLCESLLKEVLVTGILQLVDGKLQVTHVTKVENVKN